MNKYLNYVFDKVVTGLGRRDVGIMLKHYLICVDDVFNIRDFELACHLVRMNQLPSEHHAARRADQTRKINRFNKLNIHTKK